MEDLVLLSYGWELMLSNSLLQNPRSQISLSDYNKLLNPTLSNAATPWGLENLNYLTIYN